jgi:hypothetical protein
VIAMPYPRIASGAAQGFASVPDPALRRRAALSPDRRLNQNLCDTVAGGRRVLVGDIFVAVSWTLNFTAGRGKRRTHAPEWRSLVVLACVLALVARLVLPPMAAVAATLGDVQVPATALCLASDNPPAPGGLGVASKKGGAHAALCAHCRQPDAPDFMPLSQAIVLDLAIAGDAPWSWHPTAGPAALG